MAVFYITGVYAYTDANVDQKRVAGSDLNYLAAWSSLTPYVANDVVDYGGALYIALTTNVNSAPEGNVSDEWSILVLVYTQHEIHPATVHVTADGAGVPL